VTAPLPATALKVPKRAGGYFTPGLVRISKGSLINMMLLLLLLLRQTALEWLITFLP
jgi:hypothetical protein